MFKTLSVAVLSFSLAAISFTAPARADAEDVAKVLGGLAFLYVLGRALDDDNSKATRRAPPKPPERIVRPRHKVIPTGCYRELRRTDGTRARGYGARCMRNNVARPGQLPPQCIRREHTVRGTRHLFGGRCLSRHGWTRAHARN